MSYIKPSTTAKHNSTDSDYLAIDLEVYPRGTPVKATRAGLGVVDPNTGFYEVLDAIPLSKEAALTPVEEAYANTNSQIDYYTGAEITAENDARGRQIMDTYAYSFSLPVPTDDNPLAVNGRISREPDLEVGQDNPDGSVEYSYTPNFPGSFTNIDGLNTVVTAGTTTLTGVNVEIIPTSTMRTFNIKLNYDSDFLVSAYEGGGEVTISFTGSATWVSNSPDSEHKTPIDITPSDITFTVKGPTAITDHVWDWVAAADYTDIDTLRGLDTNDVLSFIDADGTPSLRRYGGGQEDFTGMYHIRVTDLAGYTVVNAPSVRVYKISFDGSRARATIDVVKDNDNLDIVSFRIRDVDDIYQEGGDIEIQIVDYTVADSAGVEYTMSRGDSNRVYQTITFSVANAETPDNFDMWVSNDISGTKTDVAVVDSDGFVLHYSIDNGFMVPASGSLQEIPFGLTIMDQRSQPLPVNQVIANLNPASTEHGYLEDDPDAGVDTTVYSYDVDYTGGQLGIILEPGFYRVTAGSGAVARPRGGDSDFATVAMTSVVQVPGSIDFANSGLSLTANVEDIPQAAETTFSVSIVIPANLLIDIETVTINPPTFTFNREGVTSTFRGTTTDSNAVKRINYDITAPSDSVLDTTDGLEITLEDATVFARNNDPLSDDFGIITTAVGSIVTGGSINVPVTGLSNSPSETTFTIQPNDFAAASVLNMSGWTLDASATATGDAIGTIDDAFNGILTGGATESWGLGRSPSAANPGWVGATDTSGARHRPTQFRLASYALRDRPTDFDIQGWNGTEWVNILANQTMTDLDQTLDVLTLEAYYGFRVLCRETPGGWFTLLEFQVTAESQRDAIIRYDIFDPQTLNVRVEFEDGYHLTDNPTFTFEKNDDPTQTFDVAATVTESPTAIVDVTALDTVTITPAQQALFDSDNRVIGSSYQGTIGDSVTGVITIDTGVNFTPTSVTIYAKRGNGMYAGRNIVEATVELRVDGTWYEIDTLSLGTTDRETATFTTEAIGDALRITPTQNRTTNDQIWNSAGIDVFGTTYVIPQFPTVSDTTDTNAPGIVNYRLTLPGRGRSGLEGNTVESAGDFTITASEGIITSSVPGRPTGYLMREGTTTLNVGAPGSGMSLTRTDSNTISRYSSTTQTVSVELRESGQYQLLSNRNISSYIETNVVSSIARAGSDTTATISFDNNALNNLDSDLIISTIPDELTYRFRSASNAGVPIGYSEVRITPVVPQELTTNADATWAGGQDTLSLPANSIGRADATLTLGEGFTLIDNPIAEFTTPSGFVLGSVQVTGQVGGTPDDNSNGIYSQREIDFSGIQGGTGPEILDMSSWTHADLSLADSSTGSAADAFNGDISPASPSTSWGSGYVPSEEGAGLGPTWLSATDPSGDTYIPSQVRLVTYSRNDAPSIFDIQGWNGSAWVNIITNQSMTSTDQTFDLNTTEAYSGFRIFCTGTVDGGWLTLVEFRVIGQRAVTVQETPGTYQIELKPAQVAQSVSGIVTLGNTQSMNLTLEIT